MIVLLKPFLWWLALKVGSHITAWLSDATDFPPFTFLNLVCFIGCLGCIIWFIINLAVWALPIMFS
jgi:hypothetical protein